MEISIHALLAESDHPSLSGTARHIYFYPRSPCGERRVSCYLDNIEITISIHALLAESDANWFDLWGWAEYFYPRSPCGERRLLLALLICPPRDFYPRSPCGERHNINNSVSTADKISIHALLAESDCW